MCTVCGGRCSCRNSETQASGIRLRGFATTEPGADARTVWHAAIDGSETAASWHDGGRDAADLRARFGRGDESRYGFEWHQVESAAVHGNHTRRFGKTTAVSMFVAAFALCVPGSVTAIFSTGRRASNLLLQQIKAMVSCIPGAEKQIVSSNVETLVIQSGEKLSKISSFPGKARTLRGTGGDLVILEEAAFIAPEVWTEVVIPLIEVKNTALVAISTPLDSSNFYSTLVTMKDERDEPIFHVLEARAACEKCIQTLDDPSKCPHVNLERPQWKSKKTASCQGTLFREPGDAVTRIDGCGDRRQWWSVFEAVCKALV